MSTVFYYLLKQPGIMHRLQVEIRSFFKSYDEINALSTTNLPYTVAVIREAMRIYPPLALALPRIVPEGGDTIDGNFVPAGVRHARYRRKIESNFYRPWCQHTLLQRAWTRKTSKTRGRFAPRGGLERVDETCETHRSLSR
jgi:hypothetical protein